MRKFSIQDRIVLDEMVDTFTAEMNKTHDDAELMDKRPIITREYWLQMIKEVQSEPYTWLYLKLDTNPPTAYKNFTHQLF